MEAYFSGRTVGGGWRVTGVHASGPDVVVSFEVPPDKASFISDLKPDCRKQFLANMLPEPSDSVWGMVGPKGDVVMRAESSGRVIAECGRKDAPH